MPISEGINLLKDTFTNVDIGGFTPFIGITILAIILVLITRDVNKWKLLAFPINIILMQIGIYIPIYVTIITGIIFVITLLSTETIGKTIKATTKAITEKIENTIKINGQTIKIRKRAKKMLKNRQINAETAMAADLANKIQTIQNIKNQNKPGQIKNPLGINEEINKHKLDEELIKEGIIK